jgi:hypothetical protein
MKIGFDMVAFHLDQITDSARDAFRVWNGGKKVDGKVQGGEAAFGARNFLGGQWIWGASEATDSRTNPHPDDLTKLHTTVPLIAPVQAAQSDRQNVTGTRGHLYGQIDAQAICDRIATGMGNHEFQVDHGFILVWLAVDPDEPLSVDYWGGWSEQVNTYSLLIDLFTGQMARPFLSAILCQYTESGGKLRRAQNITDAVIDAHKKYPGSIAYAFWADAPDPNEDGVAPNPVLDWQRFVKFEMPSMWRFANTMRNADGTSVNVLFHADAVKEPTDAPAGGKTVTDYMLTTLPWQPYVAGIRNIGFSSADAITNAGLTCTLATPMPKMKDSSGHFVDGAFVTIIGRYAVRPPGQGDSLTFVEAKRLSDARMQIFTIFERFGGPTKIGYFRPPAKPADDGQGNLDARDAFNQCAFAMRQPPQTPVFFTVDFDGGDTHETPDGKAFITDYFRRVRAERDAFTKANPDHHYLIGVYAGGDVMQWLYELGDVDYFWQTLSPGFAGSHFADNHWPWYHLNRWQYQGTADAAHPLPGWNCVPGFDPDADWGDGGGWNLNDRPAKDLLDIELQEFTDKVMDFFKGLLNPK